MIKKTKILFYSGHGEIVGGDAKYFFDLINNINLDKYEIEVFTDKNYLFEQRVKQWLLKDIPIKYLDTQPVLFKKNWVQILYEKIADYKGNNKLIKVILICLNYKFLGHSVYKWFKYIWSKLVSILTFAQLRAHVYNALLFYHLFKKHKADIFHFNNGGYPAKKSGLIAISVAYSCGIKKTIMTIHNPPEKRKWYRISDYFFDALISKYCKKIITASKKLKKEMNSKRKFPLDQITTIYCGLYDAKQFTKEEIINKKKELNLKLDAPILLITGNLDEDRKGHAVLFKSLIEVKTKYPDVILLVVGDGEKKVELMALSEKYRLNDNIIFLGYRKDIEKINSIIDIAVIPSIGYEATPYTIKEAMRAGKSVITTDAGGCTEAVENNINGLVVPQKDAPMLAKAILQLLDDKRLRERMGIAGRRLFKEKFLLSNKIAEHENIYDQLLPGLKQCIRLKT